MVSKAVAKYVRVSPRKVRQVIDMIKGEDVEKALAILANLNKGARVYVVRLLKSAISSAKSLNLRPKDLYISRITADGGPMLKRYRAAPMGRATPIRKRTTHIRIELDKKQR